MKKFLLITFGCPKNEVDSDFVAGQLIEAGFNPTPVLEEADFVIVNTCSFLRSAVSENLRAIKKLSNLKKKFNFTLVVTGCLVNRFREKIFDLDVNVDFWIPGNFQPRLAEILSTGNAEFLNFEEQNYLFSARSTKSVVVDRKYAYLKISEGCNRPCSFCVIPKIRGSFRSRRIENILDEAVMLIDQG
ncbi:MAG: 30S ribosomal protein S12 methylthiotransferase RimO, partial [Deltaproteobacteria bacterium]|nr:30S ribosomal protein S12 methylthiotransferase RimO [Deltaproteobacteria bacterium]